MVRPAVGSIAAAAMVVVAVAALAYAQLRPDHGRETNWPWSLVAVNGDQLVIETQHGDCDRYRGYVVTEDPARVTLAVRMQPWSGNGNCTMAEQGLCQVVQLGQPLGNRLLVNPVEDPPVVVTTPRIATPPPNLVCSGAAAPPTRTADH